MELPESDFTYIERPWSHFVTRWAAIDVELEAAFGSEIPFSLLDLGSCMGFFSLQASLGYPQSVVLGIEGSVGVGNGTTGVQGNQDEIIGTKAVQTHLRWIQKLGLANCFLSPDVWDFQRVCGLCALGRPIVDVMLSLSVIHHIDNMSKEQYKAVGLDEVAGTVQLMAKVLLLANRHFIELPDQPWMEHIHRHFQSPRKFLEAAAQASQRQWSFVGPLCVSQWYGTRELWLLEDASFTTSAGLSSSSTVAAMPPQGLQAIFPRMLGAPLAGLQAASRLQGAGAMRPGPQLPPPPPVVDHRQLQDLGAALLAAPTALIAAHVQLREAMDAASTFLSHDVGAAEERAT